MPSTADLGRASGATFTRIADAVAPRPSRRDTARHLGNAAAGIAWGAALVAADRVTAPRGRGAGRRELAHGRAELRRARATRRRRPHRLAIAVGSMTVAAAAALAARRARTSGPDAAGAA
jgi:hypothetical protein